MGESEEKKEDVARLHADFENLTSRQSEIVESLKILQSKFSKSKITNWSVIASMLGIALTVVSMTGYLALEPMKDEILRLRLFKQGAIKELVQLREAGAIVRERTRSLERVVFKEGKDQ
jgi:hypothetical protein